MFFFLQVMLVTEGTDYSGGFDILAKGVMGYTGQSTGEVYNRGKIKETLALDEDNEKTEECGP